MPTLEWIGKKAFLNHHRQVPYRLLHGDNALFVGDPDSGNRLVECVRPWVAPCAESMCSQQSLSLQRFGNWKQIP